MKQSERKHRLHFPLSRLFPNMVTLGALCCGLSAIRFAELQRWEIAVTFILAAGFLDGMDGRLARMLNASSNFGAQLDSLSDFISFGVAPALVIYMWTLHEIRGFGWALVLFFAVCCALRLARFNTSLIEQKQEPWQRRFFTGMPSPAGGALCLLPLVLTFQWGKGFYSQPMVVAIYIAIVAMLMASRVPTFSAKGVRVRHDIVLPLLLFFGLLITFLVIEPWMALSAIGILYLLGLPLSILSYRKAQQQALTQDGTSSQ